MGRRRRVGLRDWLVIFSVKKRNLPTGSGFLALAALLAVYARAAAPDFSAAHTETVALLRQFVQIDTVGIERDRWTVDPLAAVVMDGFLYGRGAADDKCMTTAGIRPYRNLYFAPLLTLLPHPAEVDLAGGFRGSQMKDLEIVAELTPFRLSAYRHLNYTR